jgi:hypothetical protein
VLPLGAFFVFVDPGCQVARLIELVEKQAVELYRVHVRVVKLRDRFDVDLPPSYTIGSMLQQDDTVIADHELPPDHQPPPSSSSTSEPPSSPPTPPAQAIPRVTCLRFTEQPPAQVFQNREFTCTVAHPPIARAIVEGKDETRKWWPIEVRVVEQASGSALSRADYGVRMAALDHHEGVVVLFIKIRQNSFYGRRPFVISVVLSEGGAAVTSDAIVVVAKKKNKKPSTKNV